MTPEQSRKFQMASEQIFFNSIYLQQQNENLWETCEKRIKPENCTQQYL